MKAAHPILVLAGLALIALVVATIALPRAYTVERSTVVAAPPEVVYQQVSDLRKNTSWSPWKSLDRTMEFTYGDPAVGEGATYSWTSTESGDGTFTITEAEPPRHLETHIDFEAMGEAEGWWTFEAVPEGTRVTWGFTGKNPGILGGWLALAMDAMVGPMFADGLARLAAASEAAATPAEAPPAPSPSEDGG